MGLARATRNLAGTARANPMWALLGILLAPFRFARHIVGVVLFAMVLFVALFLLLMLTIWYFGVDKNGAVAQLGVFGISGAVVLVTGWMFVLPLLRRFDYDGDRADTHGSARFATAREAQALNDDHGLLIGRDVKTGTPDEVRTLRPDRQLLFIAGQRPIIAAKLRYYADREFAGRFDTA